MGPVVTAHTGSGGADLAYGGYVSSKALRCYGFWHLIPWLDDVAWHLSYFGDIGENYIPILVLGIADLVYALLIIAAFHLACSAAADHRTAFISHERIRYAVALLLFLTFLLFLCELGPPPYGITGADGYEITDRWEEALLIKGWAEEIWSGLEGEKA